MSIQPTHLDSTDLDSPDPTSARDRLVDHRVRPRGVLPRHLQTWMMAGLTAAMLLIIVVTGRPTPQPRKAPDPSAPQASSALPPDRLRRYQEQLAEQEARLRQEIAATQAAVAAAEANATPPQIETPAPADPLADEQRRRAYSSLFAENVAFTRRGGQTPAPARPSNQTSADSPAARPADEVPPGYPPPPPAPPRTDPPRGVHPQADDQKPPDSPGGTRPIDGIRAVGSSRLQAGASAAATASTATLLEGTIIDAVLTNRLDGSMTSPVNALVTWPIYTADGQLVVIPAGARFLGTAAPVQALGESRLAVKFHRVIMPNGQTYSLEQFTGLNQRGDAGLKDQVNRHYLQLFGASLAIGSLSGLAQFSTRSGSAGTYSFSDAYGQGLGGSLASSAGRILDRFLNVLPTVTIREGHRLKIYLTSDLALPPYPEETRR